MVRPDYVLRRAYETVSLPIVDKPTTEPKGGLGLSGMNAYERYAEAACLIHWCVANLSSLEMAYVRCQYGNDERGFSRLEDYFGATLCSSLRHRKGIRMLIHAYCGKKIGIRQVRQAMGCGINVAQSYRYLIYRALDELHASVVDRLASRYADIDTKMFRYLDT